MLRYTSRAIALAGLIALSAFAIACHETAGAGGDRVNANKAGAYPQSTEADREFAMKTTQTGKHEVELGRLAVERASDSEVKSFANRMIRDHSSAGDELAQITARLGIKVTNEDETSFKQLVDRLSQLTGAGFDRDYMSEMVEGHQNAAAMIESYASNGNNADLKAWASKAAPVVREHLQMAKDIAARIGAKPR